MPIAPVQKGKTSFPMRLPVNHGWQLVMLEDRILVAEQPVTWQLKRSHDLQHSILALTGLDNQLERPNPTNCLMSADKICRVTHTPFCPWMSNYLGNENNVTVYYQHEYTDYVALMSLGEWVCPRYIPKWYSAASEEHS